MQLMMYHLQGQQSKRVNDGDGGKAKNRGHERPHKTVLQWNDSLGNNCKLNLC